MAQGKAWNIDEVMASLEPFFKLGCSVNKACDYAGFPRTTVQTWIENDELLRLKVTAWQNEMSMSARATWKAGIEAGDINAAKDWMKREKDEFSERKELTGGDGVPLTLNVIAYGDTNASSQVPTEELPASTS